MNILFNKTDEFLEGGICGSWLGLPSEIFRDFDLWALERLLIIKGVKNSCSTIFFQVIMTII